MHRTKLILIFSVMIASSTITRAQGRLECGSVHSKILGRSIRYCAALPASYETEKKKQFPIVYLLHGLGDDERSLLNTGAWDLFQNLEEQHEIGDFLIVTPEGDRSFYINSAGGRFRYSDFFLREFMPFIEQKYRVMRERKFRAISGVSMGGYGALRMAFAHPELFSAVSAQSAALITQSPHSLDVAFRSGTPLSYMLGPVFGDPIDVAHWNANNPFELARENRERISALAIYFNCGRDDNYGFNVGAEALHRELVAENIAHDFHLYSGNHSVTYFLTHFPEVMEFHSRVFGLTK
jgi:S-formylglutathione hydrolase FrmB